MEGLKNTWKAGGAGKAGIIGGGLLAGGLLGNALLNKNSSYQEANPGYALANEVGLDENQLYIMEKAAAIRGVSLYDHLVERLAPLYEQQEEY